MPGSGTDAEIDVVYFKQGNAVSPGGMAKISQLIEEGLAPDAIADLDIAAGSPAELVEIWRGAARHIVAIGATHAAPIN